MTTFYSCTTTIDREGRSAYRLSKFIDGDVESSYITTLSTCDCPAGQRPTCRHRKMLPQIISRHLVNSALFWDYDREMSVDINGLPARETVEVEPTMTSPISGPVEPTQLSAFPDDCLAECTTPKDCLLNGCARNSPTTPAKPSQTAAPFIRRI